MMSSPTLARPATTIRGLWLSMRPHQWVKNLLVFSGLVFSRSLLQTEAAVTSIAAFAAFCLASSGVYLVNDLWDLEADRLHPVKRFRPLAAGLVSPRAAKVLAVVVVAAASALCMVLPPRFVLILGGYVAMNLLYSFGLKRVVILDVMIVSLGFVLRAVAGAVAIGVEASPWLVICTLMLALFVSFGKRRHELVLLDGEAGSHRVSLEGYTRASLDTMMGISAASAVVTYALYTMAPETVARVGSRGLILTIPFVMFGVFRFLHRIHDQDESGDPTRIFLTDRPLLIDAALWVVMVGVVMYTRWVEF